MSQKERVLKLLQRGEKITQAKAFTQFGICCLAERIRDLRKDGHDIAALMVTHNGKRFSEYRMAA
jgi:hypothetical protein